jgi:hypothetical protein
MKTGFPVDCEKERSFRTANPYYWSMSDLPKICHGCNLVSIQNISPKNLSSKKKKKKTNWSQTAAPCVIDLRLEKYGLFKKWKIKVWINTSQMKSFEVLIILDLWLLKVNFKRN